MFRETSLIFGISQFYVGFVLGKVPLGQVSLHAFRFSSVSIVLPALRTHAFFVFSQQLTQSLKKKSKSVSRGIQIRLVVLKSVSWYSIRLMLSKSVSLCLNPSRGI